MRINRHYNLPNSGRLFDHSNSLSAWFLATSYQSRAFSLGKVGHRSTQSASKLERVVSSKKEAKEEFWFEVRQFMLMSFLRYPFIAKPFAQAAASMLHRGGMRKSIAEKIVGPLTKSFSIGESVPDAVKNGLKHLNKNQQLLLDYTEEMLNDKKDREKAFQEINNLLDEIGSTELKYVPIKLTALLDPDFLVNISAAKELSVLQQSILDAEKERIFQLAEKASRLGKILFIDQEYPHQKKAIFNIAMELMEKYNVSRPVIYITIQATDIECIKLVKQMCYQHKIAFPAIKLVNGAYVEWAHKNGYKDMIQPNKMTSFISFILIAKFCLKKGVHLYMGTHNVILEKIIDNFKKTLDIEPELYVKGQLFGFTTRKSVQTMYSIFGPTPSCIHYSLRRVIEGSGSYSKITDPVLNHAEVLEIVKKENLGDLTAEEIDLIKDAIQLNVQDKRIQLARENISARLGI